MTIQSDFKEYTNALGFISNKPGGSTGNDLLFSCEAAIMRKKLGAWTADDELALKTAVSNHSRIYDGLYGRPGWMQDQEAPDDYYGLAAWSTVYAINIHSYAESSHWYFKTSKDAKWWEPAFFRFPAFMAHIKWCALETPNPLLRLCWAVSVAFSGSKTSQDPWILSWLLTEVSGNQGWIERLATKIYKYRLAKNMGSLKAVFAAYFGDPNHPLVKYCP
jgi:hypothetical protein